MSEDHSKKTKLPLKSINGRRCLTKCYPKGEVSVHPIILTGITLDTNNYCSIDPVYSKDPSLYTQSSAEKEFNMIFVDTCRLEDNKIYQPPDEKESFLLSFYFNPNDFLINLYNIHSFEEAIYWTLENDHLPFDTIRRVHNCAWKVHGNKIESLTSTVIDYYYNLAKEKWLRDYAKIIRNKYSFSFISDEKIDDLGSNLDNIYQIIATKFFSYSFFSQAIRRYVYQYQDEWEEIISHYGKLKNFIFNQLIDYLENKL